MAFSAIARETQAVIFVLMQSLQRLHENNHAICCDRGRTHILKLQLVSRLYINKGGARFSLIARPFGAEVRSASPQFPSFGHYDTDLVQVRTCFRCELHLNSHHLGTTIPTWCMAATLTHAPGLAIREGIQVRTCFAESFTSIPIIWALRYRLGAWPLRNLPMHQVSIPIALRYRLGVDGSSPRPVGDTLSRKRPRNPVTNRHLP